MAVTFCNVSNQFASGTRSGTNLESSTTEYQVEYTFKTDSAADGPEVILRYCVPSGGSDPRPYLGKEYRQGNDSDPNSICTKISAPQREKSNPRLWKATGTFTPKTQGSGEQAKAQPGENGVQTTDPTLWLPGLSIKSTQINIPVEEAIYLKGFKGAAAAVCPPNTKGCVTNSAFVEYNPGLERELTMKIYTFTQYFGAWLGPSWDLYEDAINAAQVVFAGNKLNFSSTWEQYKARIKNFDGSLRYINGFKVWERNVEIHVNPLGWDRHIVDRGLLRRADPRLGDPDGHGGTFSSSDRLPKGVPPVRHIMDENDIPITEPVLFDGDGQPLEDPSPGKAVYLDYRVYMNVRDFAPLKLAG